MNVEEIIKATSPLPIRQRTILHLLLIGNKVAETLSAALKPYEVSMQQFNVLRILRGQKGVAANMCTLNERMVTKMSNTTRLVDKLIDKGYVRRNTCNENRRKIEIHITENGKKALQHMDEAVKDAELHLLRNFEKEDLIQFNKILELIKN